MPTFMICNWTPSSVCGPLKHPHIVSTIRSIKHFPGVVESGVFPVRWPYAINFWKYMNNIINMKSPPSKKNIELIFLMYPFFCKLILNSFKMWCFHKRVFSFYCNLLFYKNIHKIQFKKIKRQNWQTIKVCPYFV